MLRITTTGAELAHATFCGGLLGQPIPYLAPAPDPGHHARKWGQLVDSIAQGWMLLSVIGMTGDDSAV